MKSLDAKEILTTRRKRLKSYARHRVLELKSKKREEMNLFNHPSLDAMCIDYRSDF